MGEGWDLLGFSRGWRLRRFVFSDTLTFVFFFFQSFVFFPCVLAQMFFYRASSDFPGAQMFFFRASSFLRRRRKCFFLEPRFCVFIRLAAVYAFLRNLLQFTVFYAENKTAGPPKWLV